MRRLLKTVAVSVWCALAATTLVVVTDGGSASACSCAAVTEAEFFRLADAVFTARLVRTELPPSGDVISTGDPERFIFDVDAVYKGRVTERQKVLTARDGASCGLEISGPGPFLVFASSSGRSGRNLWTSLCSGTRALSERSVPAGFGRGAPPIRPVANDPGSGAGQPSPDPLPPAQSPDGSADNQVTPQPAGDGDGISTWWFALPATLAAGAAAVAIVISRRRHTITPAGGQPAV